MRARAKQAGLAFVSLIVVALAIAGSQGLLKRTLGDYGAFVLAAIVLLVFALSAKFIERREPTEIAPRTEVGRLLSGFLLGLLLFTAVIVVLGIAGVYHYSGIGSFSGVLHGLAFATAAGVIEEVLFRGLLFRILSKAVGTWGALLLTSALFGAAHLGNPGATLGSAVAIAVEAGVLLGAAYVATGGLGVPIGVHIGWNFCEGSIFGMAVSGSKVSASLFHGSLSGPAVLTGGAFGPENSIVAVILCLLAAVFFLRKMWIEKRIESPMWMATSSDAESVPATFAQ